MKYVKAKDVLPKDILEMVQKYVDGEYLYIPRKDMNRKAWGEKSGAKNILQVRNLEIYEKYSSGTTVDELSQEYYLSRKSIWRIISQAKHLFSKTKQNRSMD